MHRVTQLGSSTSRRVRRADYIFCTGILVMRLCSACVSRGVPCVVSNVSDVCAECTCFHRFCKLAPPYAELDHTLKAKDKIEDQLVAADQELLDKE